MTNALVSCRYFRYSTEFIIWARKSAKKPHYFNYELMRSINGDKQMTDVWHLPAIATWEKKHGKHPTQKPLALLTRIILASTRCGGWVLDPFAGSSTTGVAASLLGRRFLGIDKETAFLETSKKRRMDLDNEHNRQLFERKIKDISFIQDNNDASAVSEDEDGSIHLPF